VASRGVGVGVAVAVIVGVGVAVGLRVGVDVAVGMGEDMWMGVPNTGEDTGGAGREAAAVTNASGGNEVEIHRGTVTVAETEVIAGGCPCAANVSAAEWVGDEPGCPANTSATHATGRSHKRCGKIV